jgi:hypothetical protein
MVKWNINKGSSDSIVTGYGLDDRRSGVRFPEGAGNFSLLHRVHPASYSVGTGDSFLGGKAAGAWSWPLNSF